MGSEKSTHLGQLIPALEQELTDEQAGEETTK
jgi:hypothetical protein